MNDKPSHELILLVRKLVKKYATTQPTNWNSLVKEGYKFNLYLQSANPGGQRYYFIEEPTGTVECERGRWGISGEEFLEKWDK